MNQLYLTCLSSPHSQIVIVIIMKNAKVNRNLGFSTVVYEKQVSVNFQNMLIERSCYNLNLIVFKEISEKKNKQIKEKLSVR